MSTLTGPWARHARQWQWMGPPLRPDAEDVRMLESALARWSRRERERAPDVLLLGVTPEIATMRWPSGTRLLSVDHSEAMIRCVWLGAGLPIAAAVCANWSALPLADATRDVVICDGGFTGLAHPGGYLAVTGEVRRLLRVGGMLLARCFIRPDERESVDAVVDDLRRGRIGSIHAFKWRLATALHGALDQGVRLADIWEAWHAAVPDPARLAARAGWPLQSVLTIDAYRGVEARYTFPTLAEARAAMAAAFEEIECLFPSYELGERCPTLMFRPR